MQKVSMFAIAIAINIFASTNTYAGEAARVYFYTFEYSNAADQGFSDDLTGRMVNALGKNSEKCVDVHPLGSASNGKIQERGSVGILMNAPISQNDLSKIKSAICAQKKDLPKEFVKDPSNLEALAAIKTCKASVSVKSAKLSETELYFHKYDEGPIKTSSFSLGDRSEIPNFSEACSSKGKNTWTDAAATQGARMLVAGTKGAEKFTVLGLKGEGIDWAFGFPSAETFKAIDSLSGTDIKTKERAARTAPTSH